jgi:hypothetical protein
MIKKNILIENARIGFRNFSGAAGKFNPEGRKNFCVFLETDIGKILEEDGWNVRWLEPRDENEERKPYLQVSVTYNDDLEKQKYNPKIVLVSTKGKTILNDSTINILDWAEIDNVDLTIRPRNWVMQEGTRNEKRGVKAYVKSMFVTIAEDELEKKYYDVPDSASDSIGGCGHCEACDGHCKEERD